MPENNCKGINIPLTPSAFYMKLYLKRKGSTKTKYYCNLVEATKSWLSLSETEKQQFGIKFNECKKKYTINFFKKTEPFMMMKNLSSSELQEGIGNNRNSQNQELPIEMSSIPKESDLSQEMEYDQEINVCLMDQTANSEPERHQSDEVMNLTHNASYVPEPSPLTLMTGRELFQLLNTEESKWTLSPNAEKIQYNQAVLLLKKDYLSKYRIYLESLTDKELYDCYKRTI